MTRGGLGLGLEFVGLRVCTCVCFMLRLPVVPAVPGHEAAAPLPCDHIVPAPTRMHEHRLPRPRQPLLRAAAGGTSRPREGSPTRVPPPYPSPPPSLPIPGSKLGQSVSKLADWRMLPSPVDPLLFRLALLLPCCWRSADKRCKIKGSAVCSQRQSETRSLYACLLQQATLGIRN